MNDELSQLDELIESDVLDALGEQPSELEEEIKDEKADDIPSETSNSTEINIIDDENEELLEKEWEEELDIKQEEESPKVINNIDINSTDLASLLGQLLNNKTIEITIKIKD